MMRMPFAALLNAQLRRIPHANGYWQEWWGPERYEGPLCRTEGEVYHFTTAVGLRRILATGALLPYKDRPEQPRLPVWTTECPIWDHGAIKPGLEPPPVVPGQVFRRMVDWHGPLYRLVLLGAAAPITMAMLVHTDPLWMRAYQFFFSDPQLQTIATHPHHVVDVPIPQAVWKRIDVWSSVAAQWVPVEDEPHG